MLGAAVLAGLLLVHASAGAAIVVAVASKNVASYLLRRLAGVPQTLLWKRAAQRRRGNPDST